MIKREEVFLLRLPLLRLRFRRREWEKVRRLRIGLGLHVFYVDVVVVDESTVHGGHRRWLQCPCGKRSSVLGVVIATETATAAGRLGCRQCLGWSSRSKSIMSPAVAHACAHTEEVPV